MVPPRRIRYVNQTPVFKRLWSDVRTDADGIFQLDVYYPPANPSDSTDQISHHPVILVFFYGGGLTHGSRSSPPSHLVYDNLGAFFASRGILTVIPDYRLVPLVVFPQGSEDIRDALDWVSTNLVSADADRSDRGRMYVLAHSAGGVHVSGFLLTPSMFSGSLAKNALCGVALIGVPYAFRRAKPRFRDAVAQYYGTAKKAEENQPLSLLRRAEKAYIASLPPLRNVLAESEPRSVSSSTQEFVQVYEDKGGRVTKHTLAGHDHMSPLLALSSGIEEAWGEELVAWMTAQ